MKRIEKLRAYLKDNKAEGIIDSYVILRIGGSILFVM
jgi:hypothetical protein